MQRKIYKEVFQAVNRGATLEQLFAGLPYGPLEEDKQENVQFIREQIVSAYEQAVATKEPIQSA
ncbi:hypothetical protein ACWIDS_03650 [Dietzia maris]